MPNHRTTHGGQPRENTRTGERGATGTRIWHVVDAPRPAPSPRQLRLAELLVAARTSAGLTQVEVSSRLGRSQSYVSKVEAGDRRIDVMEFLDLAEALGCDCHAILSQVLAAAR